MAKKKEQQVQPSKKVASGQFGSGLEINKLCAKVLYSKSDPMRKNVVDEEVTAEVTKKYDMAGNAGKFSINVVDPSTIATFKQPFDKLNSFIMKNSLSIGDGKQPFRVGPLKRIGEFQKKLSTLLKEAQDGRTAFLREYKNRDAWLKKQELRLGKKFNPKHYPDYEIVEKGLKISALVEPWAGDEQIENYRFMMDSESMASMKKAFDAQNAKIKTFATKSLWSEVLTATKELSDICNKEAGSGKGSIFRETFLPKIKDLVERIPNLNFDGDTELEKVRESLSNMLSDVTSDQLRKDPEVRKDVGKKSRKLLEDVASYSGETVEA